MTTTPIVEIFTAVFLLILLIRTVSDRRKSKSNRFLGLCLMMSIFTMLIDMSAYVFTGPAYPVAVRYTINLLAYESGAMNAFCFTLYTKAFITERKRISPWTFRSAVIVEACWFAAVAHEFVNGRFIVYNNGTETEINYTIPLYLTLISISVLVYLSVVAVFNRKAIGRDVALLFCVFNAAPVIGALISRLIPYDFSYVFSAIALAFIAEFVQNKLTAESAKQQLALSDGLAREYHTVWLMDGFGSHNLHLYRSTGKTTVQSAVRLGLDEPCFDTSVIKYIYDNVVEEDQERVIEETKFETIARETPEAGTYAVTYRRYTADRKSYTYHQMCFARATGADGTVNYILAYRDADKMMREQIAAQKQLRDALDSANTETQRNEVIINAVNGGRFTYDINADDEVTGAVYSEVSAKRIGEDYLDKTDWMKLLHPEDRDRIAGAFYSCVRDHSGKTPYDVTFRMTGTDGNYRWVRSAGKVLRNEDGSGVFYGISMDITQRVEEESRREKELEEALNVAKEESLRRNMIYQISDSSQWSYEVSADDEVISVSYSDKLLDTIHAAPSGEAMGWINIVHPEDKDRVLAGFNAAITDHSGNTVYDESYRIKYTDGEWHWVHSAGRVIRRADGSGEYIGMATDFTAQMKEQEEHQRQLADALNMADEANRAKTDFLFNMSHDIRTPMNAIIGFTNIAKKEINNPEKALDSLEKVQVSSDILLNLINDVLDMSRIESGKVELHETKYGIVEAYDSFEPAMASLAASKDIDLQFGIGEVRDRFIFADGPRFDRVLINIISNAIKYTPAGGTVKVHAEQIEDTEPGYGNYRFTVSDNGIGMSEEFQKHMFEDFTREENTTMSGVQGTGLGLSLAKKIVDLMGGTISCVSRQGEGTVFTLVFPFRLQTEADMTEEAETVREIADVDFNGKRALLVEDNELNREIAEEILSGEGIAVESAEDGQKAVDKVREHRPDYYDFILMDIQMPVMDGYEASKTIRSLMPDLKAPIIALSANAFAEDRQKSIEAGMDGHVAKPIDTKELFAVLAKLI